MSPESGPLSYAVLGSTPWETPWGTDQNLAFALSRTAPLLYVDPPLSPLTPFRYGLSARTLPQLRELARRRRSGSGGVPVVRPLALPPVENARSRRASRPLVRRQVRSAAAHAGVERPVLVAMRSLLDLSGALDERLRVFVVMDWFEEDAAALLGRDPGEMAAETDAMCAAADLVVCTSAQLRETLAGRGVEAELLRQAFPADLIPAYDAALAPPEYGGLPRPILAFTGRIDGRLHVDAIARLAERFASGSLVFVGPVSPRMPQVEVERLAAPANVHLIGQRARAELPSYLVHADCLLIPYVDSPFARHGLPVKLGEYLYAGPPVVGSGYPSLKEYPPPLVTFAGQDRDALADAVDAALGTSGDEAAAEARRAHARENTWDHRARALEAMVRSRTQACNG